MQRIDQSHNWMLEQRKWLERLIKPLVHEMIIEHEFVNNRFSE
jgi:type I restriction enzyme R subunit